MVKKSDSPDEWAREHGVVLDAEDRGALDPQLLEWEWAPDGENKGNDPLDKKAFEQWEEDIRRTQLGPDPALQHLVENAEMASRLLREAREEERLEANLELAASLGWTPERLGYHRGTGGIYLLDLVDLAKTREQYLYEERALHGMGAYIATQALEAQEARESLERQVREEMQGLVWWHVYNAVQRLVRPLDGATIRLPTFNREHKPFVVVSSNLAVQMADAAQGMYDDVEEERGKKTAAQWRDLRPRVRRDGYGGLVTLWAASLRQCALEPLTDEAVFRILKYLWRTTWPLALEREPGRTTLRDWIAARSLTD